MLVGGVAGLAISAGVPAGQLNLFSVQSKLFFRLRLLLVIECYICAHYLWLIVYFYGNAQCCFDVGWMFN